MNQFIKLQNEITNKLPDDIYELNCIIKMIGQILFGDTWEEFEKTLVKGSVSKSEVGEYLLFKILYKKNNFNKQETNELINQLFRESLNKINN